MNTNNKPIVDYQTPQRSKPVSQKTVLWVFVGLAFLLILFFSLILVSSNASPQRANQVKCASNLRFIGQALQLYNSDQKTYPDTPERLITNTDLSAEVFICPSTTDTATSQTNPTLKDHCSYIFLFQTQSAYDPGDVILAYEDPNNHNGDGANFLFNDLHVEWYSKQYAKYMISELNAGHNPPRNRSSAATQP